MVAEELTITSVLDMRRPTSECQRYSPPVGELRHEPVRECTMEADQRVLLEIESRLRGHERVRDLPERVIEHCVSICDQDWHFRLWRWMPDDPTADWHTQLDSHFRKPQEAWLEYRRQAQSRIDARVGDSDRFLQSWAEQTGERDRAVWGLP